MKLTAAGKARELTASEVESYAGKILRVAGRIAGKEAEVDKMKERELELLVEVGSVGGKRGVERVMRIVRERGLK